MTSQDTVRSRRLQIGSSVVVLESPDPGLLQSIESLFAGFETAPADSAVPPVVVALAASAAQMDRFQASLDGAFICQNADRHELALAVTRKLNRYVLDTEPHRLHLHAGAVTRDGTTVLIIGSSFAGKSTLVAKLVALGWSYLSDEQIGVTPDAKLVPFPRPITLRSGSWAFFDPKLFPKGPGERPDRVEISPTALGDVYRGPAIRPTLVICPDVANPGFACTALTSGDTLARLVSDTLDMERAADAGLTAMLHISANVPAYELAGQDLQAVCEKIARLATASGASASMPQEHAVAADEATGRAPNARSWLFADGSAVLFEPVSGALVQVDEAGFAAWQLLGEPRENWPEGLAASMFVTELTEIGLLTLPTTT